MAKAVKTYQGVPAAAAKKLEKMDKMGGKDSKKKMAMMAAKKKMASKGMK